MLDDLASLLGMDTNQEKASQKLSEDVNKILTLFILKFILLETIEYVYLNRCYSDAHLFVILHYFRVP